MSLPSRHVTYRGAVSAAGEITLTLVLHVVDRTMGKTGSKWCTVCCGILFPCCILTGLVLIGLGVTLYLTFPDVVASQINKVWVS